MYFFRTLKKSTAQYKVHYIGLRYIKITKLIRKEEREPFLVRGVAAVAKMEKMGPGRAENNV